MDQDGDVTKIGRDRITLPVQKSRLRQGKLEIVINDDQFVMMLVDHLHASLQLHGMRPWNLERAQAGSAVILARSLLQRMYTKEIQALRAQLGALVKQDQDARLVFDEGRMAAADANSRAEILRFSSQYGCVTRSLAGKDAAHNFWLLVQHQTPEMQRLLLPVLENNARNGNASMGNYAYLYDRVQV